LRKRINMVVVVSSTSLRRRWRSVSERAIVEKLSDVATNVRKRWSVAGSQRRVALAGCASWRLRANPASSAAEATEAGSGTRSAFCPPVSLRLSFQPRIAADRRWPVAGAGRPTSSCALLIALEIGWKLSGCIETVSARCAA
jgi:hypothetical protein